jgi:endonuclease G, mitochondrial
VRRDDAAWGGTKKEAQLANDDTFHFTNCSPQHEIYNQSGLASSQGVLLWGNLENHIARQAKENNKKLCIFNGPIFRSNDRKHAGVQIPKEFFKVVTFEHDDGEPRSLAFILSQASLIKDLPAEEFEVGPYRPFQVTISELESRTKLKFGPLRQYDPLESGEQERFFESDLDAVAIESLEDVIVGVRSPRRRLAPR